MIVLMFIGSICFSVFAPYSWGKWLALPIPLYLMFFNCLPIWLQPTQIDLDRLRELLSPNWRNADALSEYMRRHWIALEYAPYTRKFAAKICFVALGSGGLAVYFYQLDEAVVWVLLAASSVILFLGGMRVNRPLGMFEDLHLRDIATNPKMVEELSLSACALVAYSELFPDKRMAMLVAGLVLESEVGSYAVKIQRLNPIASHELTKPSYPG